MRRKDWGKVRVKEVESCSDEVEGVVKETEVVSSRWLK